VIDQLVPWVVWMIFFLTLAVVGRHSTRVGTVTSSPRSLTQTSTISAAADCRGDTLQERGEGSEKK
jgi:hypothetical protein